MLIRSEKRNQIRAMCNPVVCAGGLIFFSSGCPAEDLPLRVQGTFVDVHASHELKVCAGTVVGIENTLLNLAAHAGVDWTTKPKVGYFLTDSDEKVQGECGRDSGGCYFPALRRVWSYRGIHEHELSHAFLHLAVARQISNFLDEGLAYVLYGSYFAFGPLSAGSIQAALLRQPEPEHDALVDHVGTSFVGYLLSIGGLSAYLRLVIELEPMAARDKNSVDRAFIEIYGQPVEALVGSYNKRVNNIDVNTANLDIWNPLGACGPMTPRLEFGHETLILPQLSSCDDPTAAGWQNKSGEMRASASVLINVEVQADDPPYDPKDRETWPARLVEPQLFGRNTIASATAWPCDEFIHDRQMSQLDLLPQANVTALGPGLHVIELFVNGPVENIPREAATIVRTSQWASIYGDSGAQADEYP